jgi:hypothetical protein
MSYPITIPDSKANNASRHLRSAALDLQDVAQHYHVCDDARVLGVRL